MAVTGWQRRHQWEGSPGLAEMWEMSDALASLSPASGARALTALTVVSPPFLAGLEAFGFLG